MTQMNIIQALRKLSAYNGKDVLLMTNADAPTLLSDIISEILGDSREDALPIEDLYVTVGAIYRHYESSGLPEVEPMYWVVEEELDAEITIDGCYFVIDDGNVRCDVATYSYDEVKPYMTKILEYANAHDVDACESWHSEHYYLGRFENIGYCKVHKFDRYDLDCIFGGDYYSYCGFQKLDEYIEIVDAVYTYYRISKEEYDRLNEEKECED